MWVTKHLSKIELFLFYWCVFRFFLFFIFFKWWKKWKMERWYDWFFIFYVFFFKRRKRNYCSLIDWAPRKCILHLNGCDCDIAIVVVGQWPTTLWGILFLALYWLVVLLPLNIHIYFFPSFFFLGGKKKKNYFLEEI